MADIDYYFFTISPFTYLAGLRMEALAEKHGATVAYKPIALMKVFEATGTLPPGQRHPSRQAHRLQEIERTAKLADMAVTVKPAHFPTNAVPSMSAVIAAQDAGGGDLPGLVHGYTRACWAEEKDIAEDAVVKEVLAANGFDPALADSGMLTGSETIEKNTAEALERGVFGSPTYVVGDQIIWGQDRLDHLDHCLSNRA